MIKLSVILPTIRVDKITKVYESFQKSYSGEHELIIVSPYDLPFVVIEGSNIIHIKDWGSPLRCQQMALQYCNGEYIHRAVDDSIYLSEQMNNCMKKIEGKDYKEFVNIRFVEGENMSHRDMYNPEFYNLQYHQLAHMPYAPHNFQIVNFSIISRKLMEEIGGWDAKTFESIAFGELDLSLRLQFHGAKPILSDNFVLKCDWIPGESGDHKPMHDAWLSDAVLYKRIYSSLEYEDRIKIHIDNWEKSTRIWRRRFKE